MNTASAFHSPAGREILVIGSAPRASLEICRSLGRVGYRVSVLRFGSQRSIADASRYCAQSLYIGSPESGVAEYIQRLKDMLRTGRFTDVVPIDDLACEMICVNDCSVPEMTRVAGPSAESYRWARDRALALSIAKDAGLLTLATVRVARGERAPLPTLPCVVRPRHAVALVDDEPIVFSTRLVHDPQALDAKLRDDLPRVDVLLQSPPIGERLDISFCAIDGAVLALATVVLSDGAGSRLRSEPPTLSMLETVRSIATRLRWTGFMTIECSRDGDAMTFIDLRCDAGDSLAVSRLAGVDQPRILLEGLAGMRPGRPVAPPATLTVNQFTRNVARLNAARRSGWFLNRAAALTNSLLRRGTYRGRIEIERVNDPWPAFIQVGLVLGALADKAFLRMRAAFWRTSTGSHSRSIGRSERILFVCKGNINRSMVAEQVLRLHGFTRVASAGLIGMSGRRPSKAAERYIVERLGVDASELRSQSIRRALGRLGGADCVICFERRHVVELVRRHPCLRGSVFLLSALAGERRPVDIGDPHGGPDALYERCFGRIEWLLRQAINAPAIAVHRVAATAQ